MNEKTQNAFRDWLIAQDALPKSIDSDGTIEAYRRKLVKAIEEELAERDKLKGFYKFEGPGEWHGGPIGPGPDRTVQGGPIQEKAAGMLDRARRQYAEFWGKYFRGEITR